MYIRTWIPFGYVAYMYTYVAHYVCYWGSSTMKVMVVVLRGPSKALLMTDTASL